jgi:hypothetical protein
MANDLIKDLMTVIFQRYVKSWNVQEFSVAYFLGQCYDQNYVQSCQLQTDHN